MSRIKRPNSAQARSPVNTTAFPRIGVFRKGSEKQVISQKNGKPCTPYEIVGKDLGDKFRFVPEVDDPYKRELLNQAIKDLCGSTEPTTIRAELMGATVDDVFYGAYTQHRSDRVMLIECDGDTVNKQYDERKKMTTAVSKPCRNKDDRLFHCQDCQPTGKLHIYFPELFRKPLELADETNYVFYGGFDILTSAITDGFAIPEMLESFELIASNFGETLQGLPVIITRTQTKYSGTDRNPKKKQGGAWVDSPTFMQSFKREDWFINIEIDMYRWMQKLAAKGKKPFEIAAASQDVFAATTQHAIAAANPVTGESVANGANSRAIAPTSPVIQDSRVRDAFIAELKDRGLDTDSKANREVIGEKLIDLGYTKIGSDGETIFGDANKIPSNLIKQVANKVEDALNGANLTTTVDVEAIATQPQKPLRTANPDDIQSYLNSTVPVK